MANPGTLRRPDLLHSESRTDAVAGGVDVPEYQSVDRTSRLSGLCRAGFRPVDLDSIGRPKPAYQRLIGPVLHSAPCDDSAGTGAVELGSTITRAKGMALMGTRRTS